MTQVSRSAIHQVPTPKVECPKVEEGLLRKEEQHRMMNFLRIMSSSLERQARNSLDEGVGNALRRVNCQIVALGTLQRLLAERQDEFPLVVGGFLDELSSALETLIFAPREVVLSRHFDDDAYTLQINGTRMRLLALCLTELLVNVAKHAIISNSSSVKLSIQRTRTELLCSVLDEGRSRVTNKTARTSQGLGLVEGLSRALGGHCSWVFTNGGTSAEISIPLERPSSAPNYIHPADAAMVSHCSVLLAAGTYRHVNDGPEGQPRWSQLKFLGWLGSL